MAKLNCMLKKRSFPFTKTIEFSYVFSLINVQKESSEALLFELFQLKNNLLMDYA